MVDESLARAFEAAHAQARARWPQIELSSEVFAAHLGKCVEDEPDPAGVLESLHTDELFLTCACAAGNAAAMREFETVLNPVLVRTVDASRREEIGQDVRTKLLVATDGRTRVADYSGRGQLANWLRVIVARAEVDAIRTHRATDRASPVFEGWADYAESAHEQDQELAPLKQRYREEFAAAFERSVAQLSDHHRNVLRHKVLFGNTVEEMAELHHVSGRTIKRWLSAARQALFELTRDALVEQLELDPREFTSVIRLIESQMDVSVRRVLGESP